MGLKLIAVCEAAGAANAIAPVVAQWRASGDSVHTVASGPAAQVFHGLGMPAHASVCAAADIAALRETAATLLDAERPDLVLAGTSWGPAIDKAMIAEAAARGIPTLAVIDSWGYYRERFSDIDRMDEGLRYLPDRVAIMDETARDEAVESGLPTSHLVVTGQPHFDDFRARVASVRDDADRLRLGVDSRHPIVMFASERLAFYFAAGTPWYRGYTEREVWEGLRAVAATLATPVTLIVKLHPQEDDWASGEAITWRHVPPLVAMCAADVVVGMTSMLLFEAAVTGKPTISFQPGQMPATRSASLRLGLTQLTRTEAELEHALTDSLRHQADRPLPVLPWSDGGASRRVVHELRALVAARSATAR